MGLNMRYIGQLFIKDKSPYQEPLLETNSLQDDQLLNHSVVDEDKNGIRFTNVCIEIKSQKQAHDNNEFEEILGKALEDKNSNESELLSGNRILQLQLAKQTKGCKFLRFLVPSGFIAAGGLGVGFSLLQCKTAVQLLMEPYFTNLYNFTGNFNATCNSSFPIVIVNCFSKNKLLVLADECLKKNVTVCAELIDDAVSSDLIKYNDLWIALFVVTVFALAGSIGLLTYRIVNWFDGGLSPVDQTKINRLAAKYDIHIPVNASYQEMLNVFNQKLSQLSERYNNLLYRREVANSLSQETNLVRPIINLIGDYAGISVDSEKAKARYAFTSETSSRRVYSFFTGLNEQSKSDNRTAKPKEQIVNDIFKFAGLK